MTGDGRRNAGFLGPTVDVLLAVAGLAIVTYPLAASVLALVDLPIVTPGLLTAVVAVGGAYPFVAGPWSLGVLGDYVLVWMATVVGLAVVAFPLAVLAGGIPEGFAAVVQTGLFGLATVAAAMAVFAWGVEPTRRV